MRNPHPLNEILKWTRERKLGGGEERERDRGREMSVNNSILEYKRFSRPQIELVYG